MEQDLLAPYDAVLVHGFGGPESPHEVMPFLRRVTGGRGISEARLEEVGRHYLLRDGRSPINDEHRALVASLRAALEERGLSRPVLWGNRFAPPFTEEALREAASASWRRVVVVPTSAFPSYSGCRAYQEDIHQAKNALGPELADVQVDKIRPYGLHPGFVRTCARLTTETVLELLRAEDLTADRIRLLFVTHSIPLDQERTSGPPPGGAYLRWHQALQRAVAERMETQAGLTVRTELVFCSRSGPPGSSWLEPDVCDRIRELPREEVSAVVVAPIGFTADHMEVVHDLDEEAGTTAREAGMAFARVPTVRHDPEFIGGLVDLLMERAAQARGEDPPQPMWDDEESPMPAICATDCCPNLRRQRRPTTQETTR